MATVWGKGRQDGTALGVAPMNANPSVLEAIEELQRKSGSYVYGIPVNSRERADIERRARRDVRSNSAGVRADGLAWGAYILERRSACVTDINLNIQMFYARSLPYVVKVLSIAHAVSGRIAVDDVGPAPLSTTTWERQRARREQVERARQDVALEKTLAELTGYLGVYRTDLIELERTAEGCRSSYLDRATIYANQVLRSLQRPRLLPRRPTRLVPEDAQVNIHFPDVEVTMPKDAFAGMTPEDVIERGCRLDLPACYGDVLPNGLFAPLHERVSDSVTRGA